MQRGLNPAITAPQTSLSLYRPPLLPTRRSTHLELRRCLTRVAENRLLLQDHRLAGTQPMPWITLGQMRKNGCRTVEATCLMCGHQDAVNVDILPDAMPIAYAADRLRCLECRSKKIQTRAGRREPFSPSKMGASD